MEKAFTISTQTPLKESEVLQIYAMTGDWDITQKWSELSNRGIEFSVIKIAISCGAEVEGLESFVEIAANNFHVNERFSPSEAGEILNGILKKLSVGEN